MIKSVVPQNYEVSWKHLLLLIVIAYLFSLGMRLIWIYQFSGYDPFYWNSQLMINTNDGYYFTSAVEKILNGSHTSNPRIIDEWRHATVVLTALLVKITPWSLDTIALYLPAVVSSLIVVPMILIGRLYGMSVVGFLAAVLGSIGWSYYNRTMVGYYDTDMFSVMGLTFVFY